MIQIINPLSISQIALILVHHRRKSGFFGDRIALASEKLIGKSRIPITVKIPLGIKYNCPCHILTLRHGSLKFIYDHLCIEIPDIIGQEILDIFTGSQPFAALFQICQTAVQIILQPADDKRKVFMRVLLHIVIGR